MIGRNGMVEGQDKRCQNGAGVAATHRDTLAAHDNLYRAEDANLIQAHGPHTSVDIFVKRGLPALEDKGCSSCGLQESR
jgi:hypothetical protein